MRSWFVLLATLPALAADRTISFTRDVQPLLAERCWKCHGAAVQLARLDLRTSDTAARVLSPGNPEKSKLYRMVSGREKPLMPMDGKLSVEQVETLRLWIEQGAAWDAASPPPAADTVKLTVGEKPISPAERAWWAFRPPVRREPPGTGNPVDAFLRQAMAAKGVHPAPEADRRTLVRRAYLDLVGLPPTPAESDAFVNDTTPDSWERLVDRLLASPQYGERWGRHWLDVARYADSNGFEHDFDRPNAWRYRDYVIRAFNRDTPYDQFLREQLAGDELPNPSHDDLIATGFLRSYAKVGFREKDNPEFRYDYLDDMIATVGRGVLGLTVQCARCHDHKFDPISQKDYYRLQASLFGVVEVDHPLVGAAAAAAYAEKNAAIDAQVNDLRQQIRTLEQPYREKLLPARYAKFPKNVQEAIATPEDKRTPGQVLLANQVTRTVSVSSAEIDRILPADLLAQKQRLNGRIRETEQGRPKPIPLAAGITDGDYRFTPDGPGDEPAPGKGVKHAAIEGSYLYQGPGRYQVPPAFLLIRGDPASPGEEMQPGFPRVITAGDPPVAEPPESGRTSGRRLALAEWLSSPANPLPARVMVNRIWHHHFGRGIVPTLDNFGKMGEPPSHPELLDWLATEFVQRGWSIKAMHRLIMTSAAYRMASQYEDAANLVKDPEDQLLWRFRVQRLDAEVVRDSILAVSGALNREMGGPPVFPLLQQEILAQMKYGIWREQPDGPVTWRRSVYIYRKRGLPFPLLDIFDLPNQNISCGARNVSTVPTQALALLNDEFVLRQAELFGNRIREAAPQDPARQVEIAWKLALGRPPQEAEKRAAVAFLATRQPADLAHVLLNLNEFLYTR